MLATNQSLGAQQLCVVVAQVGNLDGASKGTPDAPTQRSDNIRGFCPRKFQTQYDSAQPSYSSPCRCAAVSESLFARQPDRIFEADVVLGPSWDPTELGEGSVVLKSIMLSFFDLRCLVQSCHGPDASREET